jgi:hypothetical protein
MATVETHRLNRIAVHSSALSDNQSKLPFLFLSAGARNAAPHFCDTGASDLTAYRSCKPLSNFARFALRICSDARSEAWSTQNCAAVLRSRHATKQGPGASGANLKDRDTLLARAEQRFDANAIRADAVMRL